MYLFYDALVFIAAAFNGCTDNSSNQFRSMSELSQQVYRNVFDEAVCKYTHCSLVSLSWSHVSLVQTLMLALPSSIFVYFEEYWRDNLNFGQELKLYWLESQLLMPCLIWHTCKIPRM